MLPRQRRRAQATVVFDTILAIVVVLVGIQLWLITIGVEAFLAHANARLLPTFLASGVCLAINGYLLRYVLRLSRQVS